ncbi:hypothetical protein [Cohnella terricola]|uniref:Uncharacterized protein n=1 Tax=Cohnella terricola TaxID=1289167 RepID=A0A559JCI7_9BACL|nr:hypothetical protein [Cohnella terricola]TVX97584.1 hypothetical protein FPZ45_17565 [Cohnella terricola]
MARGRVDLFIAKLPMHTVVLTLNGLDSVSELLAIPRNAQITLKRGNIRQAVKLEFLEGRESFADFMEMNGALARKFQLTPLRRYLLIYNPLDSSLSISPSPLSESAVSLTRSTAGPGSLSVGYELLSYLGIPERQGTMIKVRYGRNLARLRLHVPENLSDNRLRLPAQLMKKWRLPPKQNLALQFDQRNFTLGLAPLSLLSR